MIVFKQKGNFKRLNGYLERAMNAIKLGDLDKYGRAGVEALSSATPIDSGETASSWYYTIERSSDSVSIIFNNSNINQGVPIAIILQSGHGTRNGGWVQGRDYINPAIRPIFEQLSNDAWKEVSKVK